MLLRIAVAVLNKEQEKVLAKRLIGLSIILKIEFEIAIYSLDFGKLTENIRNIDMVIMDYAFLDAHKEKLSEIYKKNRKCLPVFVGTPVEKVCEFLVLRPAEHIDSAYSIIPESNQDKIKQICHFIINNINEEFQEKTDNSVIYITTKQKSYAIPKETILYCQGDLKYTIFIIDNGVIIRKLGKLQDVEDKYLWDFKRVHQSFLINPNRVEGIDKANNELLLDGNLRVPYSRRYSDVVKDLFKT